MPQNSVTLRSGVDTERTFALNEAGISQSQLIRFKNDLTQTMGGWKSFGMAIPSTARSIHAWQDFTNNDYAAVGGTGTLAVLNSTFYKDITPQSRQSSASVNVSISTAAGSTNVVTIVDANSGLAVGSNVYIRTPISIGNLLLMGSYAVSTILSTGSYTIISSISASTTISSSGLLPTFTTVAGSGLVTVVQSNHTQGTVALVGNFVSFDVPTSVGGITIQGAYSLSSIADTATYTIAAASPASASVTSTMNGGVANYLYYITNFSTQAPLGWGQNSWGGGPWGGTGAATQGTQITSSDWSQDNFGEVLLSVQADGPLFAWVPGTNQGNSGLVPSAPLHSGGGFVSMPQQILVLWKSAQIQGNGGFNPDGTQDNLIVRWSNAQDYTNFNVLPNTTAGAFHLPTGSIIRGGLQAPNYGVIWTDIDCWIMQFVNDLTTVFNFTRVGQGCGLVGPHAAGVLAGNVYWRSDRDFFILGPNGVQALPCSVWDFVFQGGNDSQKSKTVCAPNSLFNEIAWFFPFGTATENNAYVKVNTKGEWDYGFMGRTAWKDVSVLGAPLGSDTSGQIYQHEMGNMISGAANSFFRSGWWAIADGQELGYVDFVQPDFNWGTFGNNDASVQLQFFSADYPGDTPRVYGPFTVSQTNQFINPRIRGRLMAIEVISATNNVFWRLGRIRYRWAPAGRR